MTSSICFGFIIKDNVSENTKLYMIGLLKRTLFSYLKKVAIMNGEHKIEIGMSTYIYREKEIFLIGTFTFASIYSNKCVWNITLFPLGYSNF